MTLLIFSYNRALQLQTLLNSLLAYLTVGSSYSIHVLYAASDQGYQEGYDLLAKGHPGIQFHRERQEREWAWPHPGGYWKNVYRYIKHRSLQRTSNFKALTEQIIAESPYEGVMFLTDDSLFTRQVHLDLVRLATVLSDPAYKHTYSLRHGLSLRPLPATIQPYKNGGYVWQLQVGETNIGHWTWRFSVDGHLYPRNALLPILRKLNYANPNSLEGFVNEYINNVRPDLFSRLLFDDEPSLVGFILNKVQTYNTNCSFDIAPAYLNEKLLAGYQLLYHYQKPILNFQPELLSIELSHPITGNQEIIKIA